MFLRADLLPGIYKYFEDYGVEYFKDLDIWHIPQLRDKLNEKIKIAFIKFGGMAIVELKKFYKQLLLNFLKMNLK